MCCKGLTDISEDTRTFKYISKKIEQKIDEDIEFLEYLIKSLDIIIYRFLPDSIKSDSQVIIKILNHFYYQLINCDYNRGYYNIPINQFISMNLEETFKYFNEIMKLKYKFLFDHTDSDNDSYNDSDESIVINYKDDMAILNAMFNNNKLYAINFYGINLDEYMRNKLMDLTRDKNLVLDIKCIYNQNNIIP
jgi:hypothetical protein